MRKLWIQSFIEGLNTSCPIRSKRLPKSNNSILFKLCTFWFLIRKFLSSCLKTLQFHSYLFPHWPSANYPHTFDFWDFFLFRFFPDSSAKFFFQVGGDSTILSPTTFVSKVQHYKILNFSSKRGNLVESFNQMRGLKSTN